MTNKSTNNYLWWVFGLLRDFSFSGLQQSWLRKRSKAMTMLEVYRSIFRHRHCEEQFWRSQKADVAIQFLISNFGKAKITSPASLVL